MEALVKDLELLQQLKQQNIHLFKKPTQVNKLLTHLLKDKKEKLALLT